MLLLLPVHVRIHIYLALLESWSAVLIIYLVSKYYLPSKKNIYKYFVILEAHLKYSKHKQNREIRKSASRCKKHILHDSLSFLWTHTSYLITTDEG